MFSTTFYIDTIQTLLLIPVNLTIEYTFFIIYLENFMKIFVFENLSRITGWLILTSS